MKIYSRFLLAVFLVFTVLDIHSIIQPLEGTALLWRALYLILDIYCLSLQIEKLYLKDNHEQHN